MIPTSSVHSGTAHREAVVVQYAVLSHKHNGMVAGQAMLRRCALGVADDAGILAAAGIDIFQVREQPSEVHLIIGREVRLVPEDDRRARTQSRHLVNKAQIRLKGQFG